MKRFLIPCACIVAVATLAGCANTGDNNTITALNNQLSRVESIVKSTSVNEISEVSPSVTLATNEPYNSIQSFRALSNENMLREEEIRQKILNMNSQLKACTNTKYKLGKKKNNALKDITNNLSKYTSNLNATKSQVKNSVSKIKKNLKVSSINIEEATSSYITLNNSMNERYAYLRNIYDNLEQVCIILDCPCGSEENCKDCQDDKRQNETIYHIENSPYIDEATIPENSNDISDKDSENKKGNFRIVKNIDSYGAVEEENNQMDTSGTTQNTNTTSPNTTPPIPPQPQTPRFPINTTPNTPPANMPIPRPYPHGNFPNSFGYGGYGYNYGYNQINPNRNTDTFYLLNRNIDTYRYNPNFYNYNYHFTY